MTLSNTTVVRLAELLEGQFIFPRIEELIAAHIKHDGEHRNQRATEKAKKAYARLQGFVWGYLSAVGEEATTQEQVHALSDHLVREYRVRHGKVLPPEPMMRVIRVRGEDEHEEVHVYPKTWRTRDPEEAIRSQALTDYTWLTNLQYRETERGTEVGFYDRPSGQTLWTANFYRAEPVHTETPRSAPCSP